MSGVRSSSGSRAANQTTTSSSSYSSMYSSQYTERMQQIQKLRNDRSERFEKDVCATRAVRTGFVFPSTAHMDLTRGRSRGFSGFSVNKQSVPCGIRNVSSHGTNKGGGRNRDLYTPTDTDTDMHTATEEKSYEQSNVDASHSALTEKHLLVDLSNTENYIPVARALYPPSPPDREFSNGREQSFSPTRSCYHLVLDIRVIVVNGSLNIISERVGLIATTVDTNIVNLSTSIRDQMSLAGEHFTVKVKNPRRSGRSALSFAARFVSTDPADLVSISDVLDASSVIHVQIMKKTET